MTKDEQRTKLAWHFIHSAAQKAGRTLDNPDLLIVIKDFQDEPDWMGLLASRMADTRTYTDVVTAIHDVGRAYREADPEKSNPLVSHVQVTCE